MGKFGAKCLPQLHHFHTLSMWLQYIEQKQDSKEGKLGANKEQFFNNGSRYNKINPSLCPSILSAKQTTTSLTQNRIFSEQSSSSIGSQFIFRHLILI